MRYKLTISYDGTNYCGWQVQNNGASIQAILQKSLTTILRHPVDVTGSGRTDAGVHAHGQVAHFDSDVIFVPKKLLFSLNALLPPDIRVFSIEEVDATFHARYSATQKTYHYHLHLDPITDPFTAPYRYRVREKIEIKKLIAGAKLFLGERDFTSFANEAYRGSAAHDPIRTLFRFDVVEQSGGVRLELQADGFLYKMARNLVGTLLDFARGRFDAGQIKTMFAAKNRCAGGQSVPPNALFLMHVEYNSQESAKKTQNEELTLEHFAITDILTDK